VSAHLIKIKYITTWWKGR